MIKLIQILHESVFKFPDDLKLIEGTPYKLFKKGPTIYRAIKEKAIDDLVQNDCIRGPAHNWIIYFSKKLFLAPGWVILKLDTNKIPLDIYEKIYDSDSSYKSEEELVTENKPIPANAIIAIGVPKRLAQIETYKQQFQALKNFARKNKIPFVEIYRLRDIKKK